MRVTCGGYDSQSVNESLEGKGPVENILEVIYEENNEMELKG